MEGAKDTTPKLRGKLIEQPQSPLRGSLLETRASSHELSTGSVITRRDGGKKYHVIGIRETKHGKRVNLIDPETGEKVTLSKEDLESKLKTEDSPWSW